jgi:hypothetical protein
MLLYGTISAVNWIAFWITNPIYDRITEKRKEEEWKENNDKKYI